MAALQSLIGPRQRPGWFDVSVKGILDRAGVVMAARGPRELEQAAAELVGGELYDVVRAERLGMWFDWLFEELAGGAAARVREGAGRQDGAWQAPWRLLHGLTSIGSPALRSIAQDALARAEEGLPAGAAARQPGWLRLLPQIAATGEVSQMRDAYGTRFGVVAGFCYPGGTDPSVFLFDVDACGFVHLASAGVFDHAEQAAAAWRALAGEAAGGARLSPVETAERLDCLVHLDTGEALLNGSESRAVMDNWFRANRRHHDLADALRKRGMPLPAAASLYQGVNTAPMTEAFTGWYLRRHGSAPDPEVVGAVAGEWLQGALPGTWHAASPHRVRIPACLDQRLDPRSSRHRRREGAAARMGPMELRAVWPSQAPHRPGGRRRRRRRRPAAAGLNSRYRLTLPADPARGTSDLQQLTAMPVAITPGTAGPPIVISA